MKKILGLIVLVGFGFTASANSIKNMGVGLTKITPVSEAEGEGIHFYKGTWTDALKKAQKENKLIFLDAYASWCGPCKMMAKNTFTEKEVGDFFNSNFINVKMDMEKDENGPRLSRKYRLTAYPTLFFVDGNEEIIYQSLGYQKPKQLIGIGKEALKM